MISFNVLPTLVQRVLINFITFQILAFQSNYNIR